MTKLLATEWRACGLLHLDAIPRNPSGKVLKKDLRAPYWEGRDRQVN